MPFIESGGATFLETLAADERAFLIEVVVNRALNCCEFLQTSHPPEAKHRPLSSSKRPLRVCDAIVQPAAGLALVDGTQILSAARYGKRRSIMIDSPEF